MASCGVTRYTPRRGPIPAAIPCGRTPRAWKTAANPSSTAGTRGSGSTCWAPNTDFGLPGRRQDRDRFPGTSTAPTIREACFCGMPTSKSRTTIFALLAGQTWDVISPLNPGMLMYSVGWDAGNNLDGDLLAHRAGQIAGHSGKTPKDAGQGNHADRHHPLLEVRVLRSIVVRAPA